MSLVSLIKKKKKKAKQNPNPQLEVIDFQQIKEENEIPAECQA